MTELVSSDHNIAVEAYKSRFNELGLKGLKEIEPLCFDLCGSLLVNIAKSLEFGKKARADKFLVRLEQCLTKAEQALKDKSIQAQRQVEFIKQEHKSHFSQAVSFKQDYQYDALNKLYSGLTIREDDAKAFIDLKAYLEEHEWSQSSQEVIGLDALLYDLNDSDNDAQSHGEKKLKPLKAASGDSEQLEELKSLQNYREYLGRVVTENMVRQVIKEDPENAGPLNPQRLLVRTLSTMKDLSPSYVNRLVPYFDSLMTLEEMSNA